MIGLGRVARPAAQGSVGRVVGTSSRAWNDMLDVKSVSRDVLWGTAVFTTAFCPAPDRLPLHRRFNQPPLLLVAPSEGQLGGEWLDVLPVPAF